MAAAYRNYLTPQELKQIQQLEAQLKLLKEDYREQVTPLLNEKERLIFRASNRATYHKKRQKETT